MTIKHCRLAIFGGCFIFWVLVCSGFYRLVETESKKTDIVKFSEDSTKLDQLIENHSSNIAKEDRPAISRRI